MSNHLLIAVRFPPDGCGGARYHGMKGVQPEWPPSPARVFQALVAGAASGVALTEDCAAALAWLECLPPPLIVAPPVGFGQRISLYVPNNDADSLADPRDVSGLRVSKVVQPCCFDSAQPLMYVWEFEGDNRHAPKIVEAANSLYQLGRGIDMAWAIGEILSRSELEDRIATHSGEVYRPGGMARGQYNLGCPRPGSLASLVTRHRTPKLRVDRDGRRPKVLFTNPQKPLFQEVSYDGSAVRLLFDLRDVSASDQPFAPWALEDTVALVEGVRGKVDPDGVPIGGAAGRLWAALPESRALISSALIGRGATEADKAFRVRIIPIASIGHEHADQAIRRVLVEMPARCPIRLEDLEWAFSGLPLRSADRGGGTPGGKDVRLVLSEDVSMLRHYAIGGDLQSTVWRSVTPIAVPWKGTSLVPDDRRLGSARLAAHQVAARAIMNCFRHAGLRARALSVRVQKEPFEAHGRRAEAFATDARFTAGRLWHAEVEFAEPVPGPLSVGDGRYLGLGVMRPRQPDAHTRIFRIVEGLAADADPAVVASALRRAVMARAQSVLGDRPLPTFFTGHEPDGSPARNGTHRHLTFVADLERARLLVIPPSSATEAHNLAVLDRALAGFSDLRSGRNGRLLLSPSGPLLSDPVLGLSEVWESASWYRATRHPRRLPLRQALIEDVLLELKRRKSSKPIDVQVIDHRLGPRGGLFGRLRIQFSAPTSGPIVIGQTSHTGGGLFVCA